MALLRAGASSMPFAPGPSQQLPAQHQQQQAASAPYGGGGSSSSEAHAPAAARLGNGAAAPPVDDLLAGDLFALSQHLTKARKCHEHVIAAEAEGGTAEQQQQHPLPQHMQRLPQAGPGHLRCALCVSPCSSRPFCFCHHMQQGLSGCACMCQGNA